MLGDRGTVRLELDDMKRFDSEVVLLTYLPKSSRRMGREAAVAGLVERNDFSLGDLHGTFHDEKPLAELGELLTNMVRNEGAHSGGAGLIRGGLPFLEINHHAEVGLGRVIGLEVVRQDRGRHVARPDWRASQPTAFVSP